ncbi:putative protein N(5)-glutamine methyltransferase [Myceligenerans halotolerans]
MHEDPALVARLRAAGCVFSEDEAQLLTEAARTSPDAGTGAGETTPGGRADPERLERLVAARIGGAPLEQVLGWAELWGRRWAVAPGVFVPRRRSELLVAEALSHLDSPPGAHPTATSAARTGVDTPGPAAVGTATPGAQRLDDAESHPDGPAPDSGVGHAGLVVVDLCCGCGALGGSVALDLIAAGFDVELHAADVDPAATTCARRNLTGPAVDAGTATGADAGAGIGAVRGGRLTAVVHDGDLDAPLPRSLRGRVDVLLCNAPYVPTEAIALMPREARDHEPRLALDGGADGLGVLRRAIEAAPGWLRPGGALLFETGHDQAEAAAGAARRAGLTPRTMSDDLGATAIVAHRP